jgi:mycothiol synthase
MLPTLEPTTFAPELNIAGLTLRNWREEADYAKMLRVLRADKHSLGLEEPSSLQDLRGELETLSGLTVPTDVFLLEREGEVIAYQTLRNVREADGNYRYAHHGFVLPEWKGRGIGRALIRHAEAVLRAIATQHPAAARKNFQVFVESGRTDSIRLLEQEGYTPARYFYEMRRDHLDNLPNYELPQGIEARPVQPEHYRAIWDALVEGFREHWGEEDHGEDDYLRWLKRPHFQPHLWHVAWDGDRVVSMVINQINEAENAQYNRRRGFTDDIATLKEYRGRGIAQALIVRGLRQFREMGMTEASLGVDAENATGALRLYEKLGYQPIKTLIAYRKQLATGD